VWQMRTICHHLFESPKDLRHHGVDMGVPAKLAPAIDAPERERFATWSSDRERLGTIGFGSVLSAIGISSACGNLHGKPASSTERLASDSAVM